MTLGVLAVTECTESLTLQTIPEARRSYHFGIALNPLTLKLTTPQCGLVLAKWEGKKKAEAASS